MSFKWYIPDGFNHSRGLGYFPSHEAVCFINESEEDAHVNYTIYQTNAEPLTGFSCVVPARRTLHSRLDRIVNDKGDKIPRDISYAVVIESDIDMAVAYSRCDTSQAEMAFATTMVPHIVLEH